MTDTTMQTVTTDFGTFDVRLTGIDGKNIKGELKAHDLVTINRIAYEVAGEFSFGTTHREWVNTGETWHDGTARKTYEEIDEPYVWVGTGYRGMRRAGGGDPTEAARTKLGVALGKAIAGIATGAGARDAALAAEREEAALTAERHAGYKREEAARALAYAEKYEAEAAKIRAGGEYDKNKRYY